MHYNRGLQLAQFLFGDFRILCYLEFEYFVVLFSNVLLRKIRLQCKQYKYYLRQTVQASMIGVLNVIQPFL